MRAKALKKWNRAWKVELNGKTNPNWTDLYDEHLLRWIPAKAGMTDGAVPLLQCAEGRFRTCWL